MAPRTLTGDDRRFLAVARRAILATIDPAGIPRLVPICFVLDPARDRLVTPLDEKPKRVADPRSLARVRDIHARPDVGVLVDRWDEDWSRLGWLRCRGRASVLEPSHPDHQPAVDALQAKYAQYLAHDLRGRPMIAVDIDDAVRWGDLAVLTGAAAGRSS